MVIVKPVTDDEEPVGTIDCVIGEFSMHIEWLVITGPILIPSRCYNQRSLWPYIKSQSDRLSVIIYPIKATMRFIQGDHAPLDLA